MIDQNQLSQLLTEWSYLFIEHAHGSDKQPLFRRLLEYLHSIFRYVEPRHCEDGLIIFVSFDDLLSDALPNEHIVCMLPQTLSQEVQSNTVIQALANGQFRVWKNVMPNIPDLAAKGFVYRYRQQTESFFAKNEEKLLPKILPGYSSLFAIPSFHELSFALENYKTKMVRQSTCKVLKDVWHEESRLFLKNAQEHVLRNSLVNHLKGTLRGDVEVRPEQIVDETHPIDIKVTWFNNNRLALIEIKWLGDSKNPETGQITATYRDARAREGAKQLADYLDQNVEQAATHITHGYLVLFDARRRGLNSDTVEISREDGHHYRDAEINFDPKYHNLRGDFEVPLRMFIEPICPP